MNLHNFKTCKRGHSGIRNGIPIGMSSAAYLLVGLITLNVTTAAAVPPENPALADAGSGKVAYADQTLRVNIWHDKNEGDIYRRGEPVRVHFETNADAYAVVYQINAEGKVTILWPRSRYDDGFVFGNHHYQLPVSGAPQILVANEEGVEYVEAIVSSYPFDLRILELDFHHEQGDENYEFYVAGDPFLALNEVNYTVTGLEDASDYVVTNFTSYYVHQRVDHPRYLCQQCHDYGTYQPYHDTCSLSVHFDFGWYNNWWGSFGYYPLYYYPAYYYVDPWCWRPWVRAA